MTPTPEGMTPTPEERAGHPAPTPLDRLPTTAEEIYAMLPHLKLDRTTRWMIESALREPTPPPPTEAEEC